MVWRSANYCKPCHHDNDFFYLSCNFIWYELSLDKRSFIQLRFPKLSRQCNLDNDKHRSSNQPGNWRIEYKRLDPWKHLLHFSNNVFSILRKLYKYFGNGLFLQLIINGHLSSANRRRWVMVWNFHGGKFNNFSCRSRDKLQHKYRLHLPFDWRVSWKRRRNFDWLHSDFSRCWIYALRIQRRGWLWWNNNKPVSIYSNDCKLSSPNGSRWNMGRNNNRRFSYGLQYWSNHKRNKRYDIYVPLGWNFLNFHYCYFGNSELHNRLGRCRFSALRLHRCKRFRWNGNKLIGLYGNDYRPNRSIDSGNSDADIHQRKHNSFMELLGGMGNEHWHGTDHLLLKMLRNQRRIRFSTDIKRPIL